ncbi:hydantoinase/carbamoylase family amidase [Brucella pseudogrignonensis]|uniref:hydantoinase/carbamoylase family amidase n=1 Tax=Brucella pseudogrignonensis TaxID=419475 RepID=UPI003ECD313A
MVTINRDRLLADLRQLATFGAFKTGVHRPTFTPQDMESRRWLAARYQQAGLDASIDGIGNVYGRARQRGPRLLVGSHAESQNYAGWLDGALGVVYALELARAFRESHDCDGLLIEPVAWADEESHFVPFLGSRSFIGDLPEEEISVAANRTTGEGLTAALDAAGLALLPRQLHAPHRYVGYIEAHIEQGDLLESTSNRIGVVTSIVGIQQYRLFFSGEQNHAGTTRMAARKDAGQALIKMCHRINETFGRLKGERTVWTVGQIVLDPGAPAIVPGGAQMLFQFRDEDEDIIARLDMALRDLVMTADSNGICGVSLELLSSSRPSRMLPLFCDAFSSAADQWAPGAHILMPSGAGHDAQIISRVMPCGMIFVPSIGGISHHWTENTSDDDIALGCQVFADGAKAILKTASI